jgi:hypothetical protein
VLFALNHGAGVILRYRMCIGGGLGTVSRLMV